MPGCEYACLVVWLIFFASVPSSKSMVMVPFVLIIRFQKVTSVPGLMLLTGV